MRLPVSLRMKESRDFARVKMHGQGFPGRCLVLSVLRMPEVQRFQFGLVTSKRIGGAVTRNLVRRRLREIIREVQLQFIDGLHLVIIARWRAPEASLVELREDLLRIAKRAGILKPAV